MKTITLSLITTIALLSSCQKPCWECRWERNYGHSQNKYILKTETFCNEYEMKEHDGKIESVLTEDGYKAAQVTCERE